MHILRGLNSFHDVVRFHLVLIDPLRTLLEVGSQHPRARFDVPADWGEGLRTSSRQRHRG